VSETRPARSSARARRARAAGARVVLDLHDLPGLGIIALVADPQGAVLGLWQACDRVVESLARDRVGLLRWMELASADPAGAARFYERVFGWQPAPARLGRHPYVMLEHEGVQVGGIAGPEQPHGRLGARWIPYFQVADCAPLSERAANLRGELLTPATAVEGVGTYAVLRDPQGAAFGFLSPAQAK
jgi:predicted enzyme related to lactoylglutathione lyase